MIAIVTTDFPELTTSLCGRLRLCEHRAYGLTFYIAEICGSRVMLANVGDTKVASAVNLSKLLSCHRPAAVIAAGNLAGVSGAATGTVVIASDSVQFDVDFSKPGYSLGEIPYLGKTYFQADPNLTALAKCAGAALSAQYVTGRVVTGDRFIADVVKANDLASTWSATGVDAETAALAECAYMYGVPFVSVKAVSNSGGDNAVGEYTANRLAADSVSLNFALKMACVAADGRCLCGVNP